MELNIEHVSKKYKDLTAVDDISLNITPGVWGLLGANGAGKTTLMRMIAGIMNPTAGQICYDGIPIHELKESYRDVFGYLPQEFGFYPEFTVKDYLEYVAVLKGLKEKDSKRKINELLERLTLSPVKNKKITKLSGGMKRRVGIAQALLNEPEVLILDEPTSGLDPAERVRFRNLLSEFAHDRIVLISTHIVSDIEYIATQNAVIKGGRLIAKGTTEELVKLVEGKVWTARIPMNSLHEYERRLQVVNIRNEENGQISIRYLAETPYISDSVSVSPHLEDLYLWLFPQETMNRGENMRLLKLEMKRVLKTRLTLVLMLSSFVLTLIMAYLPTTFSYSRYVDSKGNEVELTGLASIKYTKELQSGIAGTVTPEKMKKALQDFQTCLKKYDVEDTYGLPEGVFSTEVLPYFPMLHGIREAFADRETGIAPSILSLAPGEMNDFYGACNERIVSLMKMEQREHPQAQKSAIEAYNKVEKPYVFYPGYNTDAMDYQIMLGFLIMLVCVVIAAPVFTSDYQTGADDILRCTKYGKTRFAVTRIVSAFLICGLAFSLCMAIYITVSNSLYGWETTKTSMQMLYSIVNLPNMNIGQLQSATAVLGLLSLLATVSFSLFLSARCKNVIISVSTALAFCVLPLVVYMAFPADISPWIYGILPAGAAGLQTSGLYALIGFDFLNIGKLAVWLPHVMVGAYVVEIPLFACLAVYSYTKHNAG